jgi:ACR3 family arsenite transporter
LSAPVTQNSDLADQYVAGTIILAAAPCTAMVFVWSYLTDGDPAYPLVQVSVNDLIMLVLFAPIVTLLVSGASNLTVPFSVLLSSVIAFIVIPLLLGSLSRALLIRSRGTAWFETRYPAFACAACNRTRRWFPGGIELASGTTLARPATDQTRSA